MANFPFQRLQVDLAKLIAKTEAGDRLPSEPELSKRMGVSRATLREAMRMFEAQGLIRRRQGSGTFVVGQVSVIDAGLEVLESLETMAERLGLEVSVSDLNVDTFAADDEYAGNLNVPVGARLTRIRRVMCEETRPVAYLVDTLPQDVLKPEQLPANFKGSVLDFLLGRGDPLSVSRAAVSAIGAPPEVAKPLQIQRGDVLLHFSSKLFVTSGQVIDCSFSYFIPGYFNFIVNRRVIAGS
ncbi:MAG: GntR family transcriptional regulator [Chloroflexi bacterium]|nr:GntR family transcriptional regulator [Chloroflexota bacterium]